MHPNIAIYRKVAPEYENMTSFRRSFTSRIGEEYETATQFA